MIALVWRRVSRATLGNFRLRRQAVTMSSTTRRARMISTSLRVWLCMPCRFGFGRLQLQKACAVDTVQLSREGISLPLQAHARAGLGHEHRTNQTNKLFNKRRTTTVVIALIKCWQGRQCHSVRVTVCAERGRGGQRRGASPENPPHRARHSHAMQRGSRGHSILVQPIKRRDWASIIFHFINHS